MDMARNPRKKQALRQSILRGCTPKGVQVGQLIADGELFLCSPRQSNFKF